MSDIIAKNIFHDILKGGMQKMHKQAVIIFVLTIILSLSLFIDTLLKSVLSLGQVNTYASPALFEPIYFEALLYTK